VGLRVSITVIKFISNISITRTNETLSLVTHYQVLAL